jgi:hypothetical protein
MVNNKEKNSSIHMKEAFFRSEGGWICTLILLGMLGFGYIVAFNVSETDISLAIVGYAVYGSIIGFLFIFTILMD